MSFTYIVSKKLNKASKFLLLGKPDGNHFITQKLFFLCQSIQQTINDIRNTNKLMMKSIRKKKKTSQKEKRYTGEKRGKEKKRRGGVEISLLLPPPRALCTEVSSPSSLNPRLLTAGAGSSGGDDTFSGEAAAVSAGSSTGCGASEAPSAGSTAGVGGGAGTVSSAAGSAMGGSKSRSWRARRSYERERRELFAVCEVSSKARALWGVGVVWGLRFWRLGLEKMWMEISRMRRESDGR